MPINLLLKMIQKLIKLSIAIVAIFIYTPNAIAKKAPKDIIILDAETTKSDLGKWIKITSGDSNYVEGARNDVHIEFTGNGKNGGPADSPLEYTFTAPKTGTYRLIIRCRKRLNGEPGDKCNDGWIKLLGNFESANDVPTEDLKSEEKFFGGAEHNWGWAQMLDWQGHNKRAAEYKLIGGETYTFVLAGRSIRWNVDCIAFYNIEKLEMDDAKKIIDPNYVAPPKVDIRWNMKVDGYSEAYFDRGRKAFAVNTVKQPTDKWAAATKEFEGKKGTYTVVFTALQELDGECSYKLFIDDKEILSFTNPKIHGTDKKDYTPHKVTVKGVEIAKKAKIRVEFLPDSNGLVPEKGAFAFARARWQDIEFIKE